MRLKQLILLAAAGILVLSSCFKPEGEQYLYTNLYGIGTVSGITLQFETDGLSFTIADDQTDGKWMTLGRIFFCCDVIRATAADAYDICLKNYEPVTSKPAAFKSQTPESVYGHDPVSLYQDWGLEWKMRRLNFSCLITSLTKSNTVHSVDLVFDDVRSHSDTLFFELHHQGQGESYENTDYPATDFQLETRYMTFDFSSCIPEDAGDSIMIVIEWDWFTSDGTNGLNREVEHQAIVGELTLK